MRSSIVKTWPSTCAGPRGARAANDAPSLLAPIDSQEVWAAGVTYKRSRTARMEESKAAGGGSFYDKVYAADAAGAVLQGRRRGGCAVPASRCASGATAKWSVPEPELALVVTPRRDRRLHDRQRHELARHRGREPALPAAGEGLRRLVRARPGRR